jgi:hypothetical protein
MPAYNLVQSGGSTGDVHGDFSEAAAAEVVAEAAESLALEGVSPNPHWEYSATAEDNGTAGALDGQPGLIFKGEVTTAHRVSVRALTLAAGTIAPEAADTLAAGIYKNSVLVGTLDNETVANEYVFDELDAETITAECDMVVDAVAPGDVIRIAIIGLGEETMDVDVAVGGAFSIS